MPVNSWELIVVNDGSTDGTSDVVRQFDELVPQLTLIEHSTNCGKGAAVRTGVLAAEGEYVLFADADGATPFVESQRLLEAVRNGADVAVGSRVGADGVNRSLVRTTLASVCRLIVRTDVRDTQCGFKIFRRYVAQRLFGSSRETGYLFDLEVLGLASRCGMKIQEVPVRWHEVPGSQINLWRDSWKMVAGLWGVRQRIKAAAIDSKSKIETASIFEQLPSIEQAPVTDPLHSPSWVGVHANSSPEIGT